MTNLKQTLIDRDGITEKEAETQIEDARKDLLERIENNEDAYDICQDLFGLEPDYLFDLLETW
jgi:hypothetical protein